MRSWILQGSRVWILVHAERPLDPISAWHRLANGRLNKLDILEYSCGGAESPK
jgi:hypothetical protein